MSLEAKRIERIYAGRVAQKYDFSMPPFFMSWKKKAFDESSLKKGDRVLVFCCGTGLDFPHILKRIGTEGRIVGVDFSSAMLRSAQEKIEREKWESIEIIEADVTKFESNFDPKFDVGVCTLGMSIIPEYRSAFFNLLGCVKEQGEIIIGDMQLASGWLARLNPATVFLARKFGGSHKGHENSLKLQAIMAEELTALRKREFFFKSYFYCIGKKK